MIFFQFDYCLYIKTVENFCFMFYYYFVSNVFYSKDSILGQTNISISSQLISNWSQILQCGINKAGLTECNTDYTVMIQINFRTQVDTDQIIYLSDGDKDEIVLKNGVVILIESCRPRRS